jgi:hypothetical protein
MAFRGKEGIVNRVFAILAAALVLTGCDYTEVERETGYKGKARVNPWLAAERFARQTGEEVVSVISWTAPEADDAVWMVPASVLSNESFTRRMEDWVREGGHLILLIEHADAETNDWNGRHPPPVVERALRAMLERAGIRLHESGRVKARKIRFADEVFKVDAGSAYAVSKGSGRNGVFSSARLGDGRITVLTDGRIFRNRWIAEKDHAALLAALIDASDYEGRVGFMRGAGLSLWALLREHLAPVLLGIAVWVLLWLWKNFGRFGPLEAAAPPSVSRGYEHHLETLGHFQWKLDHAEALLKPLREQVTDFGHRACLRAGHHGDELIQFLAGRTGLSRERVSGALSDAAPADPASLTRTTADLQKLLKVLHHPSMP